MVVQGTVIQEDPTTRKTLRDESWDSTEEESYNKVFNTLY